ncbi:MAG: hypothetical protein KF696_12020 [Planctomycetes bacterium]|nr:hypothetical protein [Planctomycetota bacterium]MCW8137014.1 hypothetical protein [Planctomycetota bacterium]
MALNEQQLELLSAHLDGELTAAEQVVVNELLKQPEARQYLAELEQTRLIVSRHAMVKAPAGLDQRVLAAIKPAQIHQLPTATWRTPLYAIAAALLVALGIMFGPSLFSPEPTTSSDVARDVIERRAGKPSGSGSETEAMEFKKGAGTSESEFTGAELGRALDESRRSLDKDSNSDWGEQPKAARDAEEDPAAPKPPSAPSEAPQNSLKKPGTKEDKGAEGDPDNDFRAKRGSARAAGAVETPPEKRVEDGKAVKPGSDANEPEDATNAEESLRESRNGRTRNEEKEEAKGKELDDAQEDAGAKTHPARTAGPGQGGGGGRAAPGAAARPARQADEAGERQAAERTVTLKPGKASGAVVELLWVAALHGANAAIEADGDGENVKIEVAEDGLNALLLSIKRLSEAQGYNAEDLNAEERPEEAAGFKKLMPDKPAVGLRTVSVVVRVR